MKARVQLEAETVLQEAELVDQSKVKSYVEDLKCLLEEADLIQSKAFLRSFIKRIEISANQVRIDYRIPLPVKNGSKGVTEVLPIVPLGGPKRTFAKPVETFFELSIIAASSVNQRSSNEPTCPI
ncbi:MAG: hypothetical protein PHY18_05545 [Dehalococcoidales bacterium]|nr:hypothetical protein [Dehalococcoidales bacterium]